MFSAWQSNCEILDGSKLPEDIPMGSKDVLLHMYLN